MRYVEIGVRDLDRSAEFYSGLLGLEPGQVSTEDGQRVGSFGPDDAAVRLVEVGADGRDSGWDSDDLQCGIRHFGLKVGDIDSCAARLKAAGVRFAMEPFDAFGGVRIVFFYDPDGAYLELVQGYVQHNNLWSAELAEQEIKADAGWDGSPRFDHVAVTVPDLDEALAFYRDRLGFGGVGQLVRDGDERGFLITNLRAGSGVLEVFTYSVPTHRRDSVAEPDRLGIRAIGFAGLSEPMIGAGDVPLVVA